MTSEDIFRALSQDKDKQLGITLHNWATLRGVMSKVEIDAIETVWKGDEFLEQYREFLQKNQPIIIENILPGFFRYEKQEEPDTYYGAFFHESLNTVQVELYKEKMLNVYSGGKREISVCGPDGTTDVYFGMPAADTELGNFKGYEKVLLVPGKDNKFKGVHISNNGDTGMQITLYYNNDKVVAFSF